jgi:hypothetical protein
MDHIFLISKDTISLPTSSVCRVTNLFIIFHYIKVTKYIWDTCNHLAAETGT